MNYFDIVALSLCGSLLLNVYDFSACCNQYFKYILKCLLRLYNVLECLNKWRTLKVLILCSSYLNRRRYKNIILSFSDDRKQMMKIMIGKGFKDDGCNLH